MGVTYNPRIVTDGLIFALDAGNTKSYDKYENLVTYSEQFDNAYWTKLGSSITSNNISSPDGSISADKLIEDTSTGEHRFISSNITWSGNTYYTFSLFVKAGERTRFDLLLGTGSNWVSGRQVAFDLVSGTILSTDGASGTIVSYPNGWYRCSVTGLTIASPVASLVALRMIDSGTNASYTGNGTSSIYVWGAQVETGSTANDYYPTTASTKTRGTTVTDLSLRKNTTTLTNTPTYSSTNGGYLSFASASSQYATASNPGNLTNWTAEAFVRFTASYGSKVAMVIGGQYDLVSNLNFTIGTNNAPVNYNIAVGFFNGAWRSTTGVNYALNTWFHIVGTYDGSIIRQYTNGTQVDFLNYVGTPTSGGEIRINRRWDDVVSSGNLFDSNIAGVKIYNRALSAAEVQQNFNAGRARFSI